MLRSRVAPSVALPRRVHLPAHLLAPFAAFFGVALLGLVGCSAPPSDVPQTPRPAPVATTPPPPAATPVPAPKPARRVPTSPGECLAMIGTDAARSDATVTPEKGSGKSERFAGIVEALKRERGAMRCCYDLWAKDHPRDAGLTLAFSIDQAGAITGVQIKGDSGDAFAMEAGGCLVDVALGIRYPASPSGMTTTFDYDLGFKHHVAPAH